MLHRSRYTHQRQSKSCPCCSTMAGHHVFHPLSAFGRRDGGRYIQSWCASCRSLYS